MTQAEWIEPIPEPSIPATVDEQTAKRVAGLLKRLVSPTEERQAWLGHSPYVDDLNETLASAATPSAANVAARTESTPVVTQVQHVEPQAAEPAQTAETASAPISRAEYVRLMQTLSALQSRLQQQQSGANAAMPAQATEIR